MGHQLSPTLYKGNTMKRRVARQARWLALALFVLAGMMFAAPARSTSQSAPTPPSVTQPPMGKYLFVELWTHVDGSGKLPALAVDFPEYEFDPTTGDLTPLPPNEQGWRLSSNDWGFNGRGTSRSGAAGAGAASSLYAIHSLPFTTTLFVGAETPDGPYERLRDVTVVLRSITPGGTLTLEIDGVRELLSPGQSWSRIMTQRVSNSTFDGQYRITSSITNYGWNDRSRIQGLGHDIWLPLMQRR